jgi:ABC-type Fe3+ transport system substrate-binding protein
MSVPAATKAAALSGLVVAVLTVSACGSDSSNGVDAGAAKDAAKLTKGVSAGACTGAAWDAMVKAGKKEGSVNVAGPPADDIRRLVPAAFQDATGIKVNYVGTRASDLAGKVQAERDAKKYDQDIYLGGASTLVTVFGASGWLTPLRPLLLEDNVADDRWLEGKAPFIDPDEELLQLSGSIAMNLVYNTDLVKDGEITGWKDLLKPEYTGKIITDDVTAGGTAANVVAMLRAQPGFGDDFVKHLYLDQKAAVLTDSTQEIDALGKGTYAVGIGLKDSDVAQAMRDGLPIAAAKPTDATPIIQGGQGVMAVADHAEHPNAAQAFANWLTCPQGNTVFNSAQGQLSTLADVTIPGGDESAALQPGATYFDAYSYDFVTKGKQDGEDFMAALLGQ